jgi:hypothetical protein
MGEGPYNLRLQRQAIAWIVTHPARFARLTIERLKEFWFPTSNSAIKTAFLWSVAIAGLTWLVAHARARDSDRATLARFWLVALVAYSLVHYVIQADVRYRYPVQGLLLLATSAGAVELLRKRRRVPLPDVRRMPSDLPVALPERPLERPERVPVHAERRPNDAAVRNGDRPKRPVDPNALL